MEGFRNAVDQCRLLDLGFSGNKFMWFTKKWGGVKVRLDRALSNQEWVDLFPQFKVVHLNKSTSDHVLVLLNWSVRTPLQGKKQFWYEEAWHLQERCSKLVRNGWEHLVVGLPMCQVTEKIKMTWMMLNNWARNNVKTSPREIREVEDKLTTLLGQPFTEDTIEQKK